ncbi:unnamed protein product [Arctia plantaginis]|uniref:unspecific monooxygenase n=1 Tax=Arctia plantaginis TaxID=874455 RepID=A0A8S1AKF0_ARCPL|nr:unnamed protein product [Arctia plantaginis]
MFGYFLKIMLFLLWIILIFIALLLYNREIYSRFRRHGVKYFQPLPLLGNLGSVLMRKQHVTDQLDDLYYKFSGERFVGRFEFTNPVLYIRDLELIKKITVKDFEHFLDHRIMIDEKMDPLFGRNLLSLKGQEWKDMRSTLSPAFTSSKMRLMVPFMVEVSDLMTQSLKAQIKDSGVDYIDVDCVDLTARYANDVIASCAFGLKVDSHSDVNNEFYTIGRETATTGFQRVLVFLGYSAFPLLMRTLGIKLFTDKISNFFRNIILQTMKERELKKFLRPDMIHLLMEAKKEILRRWSPGLGLDRLCVKDYNMGKPNETSKEDYIVRKGESMLIPVWSIHHDPEFYPNPNKFDPERFAEENKRKIKPFTFIPFGLGPRNCIGSRFALCEIKVMVYRLLQQMELSPCAKTQIPAVLSMDTFNLRIKGGNWIMLFLLWIILIFIAILLYNREIYSRFRRHGVKYFQPLPLLGNLGSILMRKQHVTDQLDDLYYKFSGERFVGRFEFTNPVLYIRDLELIKKITVKDFEHFLDHRIMIDEKMDPLFGRNLLSLKGREWKDMRSTLSPAFTSSKMRLMVPFMVEVCDLMTQSLKAQIKDSGVDYIDVDCVDLTARYANDVIASCAFGLKVDSHSDVNNEFYTIGRETATTGFQRVLVFPWYAAFQLLMRTRGIKLFTDKISNFFRNIILQTMKERELKKILRPDMIHLLMEAKKGKLTYDETRKEVDAGFATVEESLVGQRKVNREWSDDDLVAQAVLFFLAGFDTVSTAMSFLLYELACNPDIQERLVQEIKENDIKTEGNIDFNSVQKMVYLDMVVSEILRRWSPGLGLDRFCVKDYNMGKPNETSKEEYIVRKGESMLIPVWSIHHDPEFYPNPNKFDPERFAEENKRKIKPFTFIPFGLGPRNCIGSRFALCEIKVMVYRLLQQMELSPCAKTQIPAVLSKDTFNLRIKGGNWVRFRTRQ